MARPDLTRRMIAYAGRLLRTRGYSPRTEDVYLRWIGRFMDASDHPHPRALERRHVERFLEGLANRDGLAPKTLNQAASALGFLYKEVLGADDVAEVERAKGRRPLPVVLSHGEAKAVLAELSGRKYLVAALLYGTGMRLTEALSLRVQDLDFELARIDVRAGKGGASRVVMLPTALAADLAQQVRNVRRRHEADCVAGGGWAPLPGALARKKPDDGWTLGWQFLFPARKTSQDPATGRTGRRHLHPTAVQRAVKAAVRRAGVLKPASCHTFRHSFATQMLRDGYDIRVVQELLGHKDVRTTMIYLHVADQTAPLVRSPLDRDGEPRAGPRPEDQGFPPARAPAPRDGHIHE